MHVALPTSWTRRGKMTDPDPDEEVIFIYDGAPAHRNLAIPATNTELEIMLPAYSPFLIIVEQAISSLKAAIKRDVEWTKERRPDALVSC